MLTQQMGYAPDYVLDRMEWYEINAAMKYSHYAIKDGWEQARLVTYMIAQVNSKHRMKVEDIVTFPWEQEKDDDVDTSISKEEIERLKAQAEAYARNNFNVEKRDNTNG